MKPRKPIPYKTKALLQKEIGSICPFCQNKDVSHFEIHHIDENTLNNDLTNLLMLCRICHSKITSSEISLADVLAIKTKVSGVIQQKIPGKIKHLFVKAKDLRNKGDLIRATEVYVKCLAIAQDIDDEFALADCQLKMGAIYNDRHELLDEALNYFKQAEKYFRISHHAEKLAETLSDMAATEISMEEFGDAKLHLNEALDYYKKNKDADGEALCYLRMAFLEHGRGFFVKSKELYYKAIELYEGKFTRQDPQYILSRIAACYAQLSLVNQAEGDPFEAETNLLKSLDFFTKAELDISIGQTKLFLAKLKLGNNDFHAGEQYLSEAITIFKKIKSFRLLAEALDLLSKLAYTVGNKDKAVEIFHLALVAAENTNNPTNKLRYYGKLAQLYYIEEDYNKAEKLNIEILELAKAYKNDDEYFHSTISLIKIRQKLNKTEERDQAIENAIQQLKAFLILTQREINRAEILGNIAAIYQECGNYIEAKKYFLLAKDAFVTLSNKNGISKCLGVLAHIYEFENDMAAANKAYSELRQLTEGSHNYFIRAASTYNLCMHEIDQDNFDLADKYFHEIEYLNYMYGLELEEQLEHLETILEKAKSAHRQPDASIEELINDFYYQINYYPKERLQHLRFWIHCSGNTLFTNYQYLEGLKFLIVTDDCGRFLDLGSKLNELGNLFLQSFSTEFANGKAELFHHPKDLLIPVGVSVPVFEKGTTDEDIAKGKVVFGKKTKEEFLNEQKNEFLLKQKHTSNLDRYNIFFIKEGYYSLDAKAQKIKDHAINNLNYHDYPGHIILGYPIIFPKNFENLLLNLSAEEVLNKKIFFDISGRANRKDKFLSDLQFAQQLKLIPVYWGKLPESPKVILLEKIAIELPIFEELSGQQYAVPIKKVKNYLLRHSQNLSSRYTLQNLKLDLEEILDNLPVTKLKSEFYTLEFPSSQQKCKIMVVILPEK